MWWTKMLVGLAKKGATNIDFGTAVDVAGQVIPAVIPKEKKMDLRAKLKTMKKEIEAIPAETVDVSMVWARFQELIKILIAESK